MEENVSLHAQMRFFVWKLLFIAIKCCKNLAGGGLKRNQKGFAMISNKNCTKAKAKVQAYFAAESSLVDSSF